MGKYMKKCKGIGEIGVMEVSQVGVRTRARTLALAAANSRRRKVSTKELQISHNLQLRSSRRSVPRPETRKKMVSERKSTNSGPDRCPTYDSLPISRCSSNGSTELFVERLRSGDLEGEGFEVATGSGFRERRESTPSSNLREEFDGLDSTTRPSPANYRRNTEKMPSEEEIEAFFSVVEKNEKKRFAEKYNYDVKMDLPLEGRYEWVRLKP